MSLYPELDNLGLEELIQHFLNPNPSRDKYMYLDEVAYRIRLKGEDGNNFLLKTLQKTDVDDEERLSALLVALSFRPSEKEGVLALNAKAKATYESLLISHLQSVWPRVVETAVDGLFFDEVKEVRDIILPLRKHSNEYVRVSVLRYLSHLYPEEAFPLLLESLKDSDYVVREIAAEELGYLGRTEVIPNLRSLLSDSVTAVQEAAKNAIASLETLG